MAKAKKRVVKKAKSTKKKVKVLPRKMSSLIKIALRDMRKAEASQNFVIDMSSWYEPNHQLYISTSEKKIVGKNGKACLACAAGSVMAFSLGLGNSAKDSVAHKVLNGPNHDQLRAIDCLREGDVVSAANYLELFASENPENDVLMRACAEIDPDIPNYDGMDPEPFHREMEKLQAKLEKAGL